MKNEWISVEDRLPEHGVNVLVTYKNSMRRNRVIVGHRLERYRCESSCEDGENDEYCEEKDNYFLKEGWYEQQDNWGEYSSISVNEGEPTHWMPLPEPPEEE